MKKLITLLLSLALFVSVFAGVSISVLAQDDGTGYFHSGCEDMVVGSTASGGGSTLGQFFIMTNGTLEVVDNVSGKVFSGNKALKYTTDATQTWVAPGLSAETTAEIVGNPPGRYIISYYVYAGRFNNDSTAGNTKIVSGQYRGAANNPYKDYVDNSGGSIITIGKWVHVVGYFDITAANIISSATFTLDRTNQSTLYLDDITIKRVDNTAFFNNGQVDFGTYDWSVFNASSGNIASVIDSSAGHGAVIQFNKSTNPYSSVHYDMGKAIISDADNGYYGHGAGRYRISFDAKIEATDSSGNDISNLTYDPEVLLQSQSHNNNVSVPGTTDYTLNTYFFTPQSETISLNSSWQRYSSEFIVSQSFLDMLKSVKDGETTANAQGTSISNAAGIYLLGLRLDGSKDADMKNQSFAYYLDNVTIEFLGNDTALYLESAGTMNFYGGPQWEGRVHNMNHTETVEIKLYNPNSYTVFYNFQLRTPADTSWDPTTVMKKGSVAPFATVTAAMEVAPYYYVTNDKKAYTALEDIPDGQSYTTLTWDKYFYLIYLTPDANGKQALPAGDSMVIFGLPEDFSAQVTASEFSGITQNSKIIPVSAKANGSLYSEDTQICAVTTNYDNFPGGVKNLGTGIKVNAEAQLQDDTYRFVGWYSGDTLLSSNTQYSFYTYENFDIEAKYVFNRVGLDFTVSTQETFIGNATNTLLKGLPIHENGNVELILTNNNAYGVYATLEGRVLSAGAWPRVSNGVNMVYIPAYGTETLTVTNVPLSFTDSGTEFDSAEYFYIIYLCTDAGCTTGVAKTDSNNRFTLEYLEQGYAEQLLAENTMPGVAANRNISQYYQGIINISTEGTGGSITPICTQYIKNGQTVTLEAELNTNGVFDGWFIDGVYAGNNLSYTFTATADKTIVAKFRAKYLITVNAGQSNLTYAINGGEAIVYTEAFEAFQGDSIVFSASANEGYSVLGFRKGNKAEMLLSDVPTSAAVIVGDEDILLQVCTACAAEEQGKANLYFIDDNGQLLQENLNVASISIEGYPATPAKEGYSFAGWSLTPEQVNAQITSGTGMIFITAGYNKIQKKVAVALAEDIVTGATLTAQVSSADGRYETLTLLTAQAPQNNGDMVFGYWYNDTTGEILSYKAEYTFYALKNVVLNVKYLSSSEAETLAVSQQIKMAQISRNKDGSLTFVSEWEFTQDVEIAGLGILIKPSQTKDITDNELTLSAENVIAANATQLSNSGIYTVTKRTGGESYWFARAYASYFKDGKTVTVYSNMLYLLPNMLPTNAESFENTNALAQTEIGNQSQANLSLVEGGIYQNNTNVLKLEVSTGYASPLINLRDYITEPGTYAFSFDYCLEFKDGGYIDVEELLFRAVIRGGSGDATSFIVSHPDGNYYGVVKENRIPSNEMWWYTFYCTFTVTQEDIDGASVSWNICIDCINTTNISTIYFDNFQLLKSYDNTQYVTGAASDFEGVSTPAEASWGAFGTCSVEIANTGYNSAQSIKSYGYPNNNTYSSQYIDIYPYISACNQPGYYSISFMAKVESKTGSDALLAGEKAFGVVVRGNENSFIQSSGYYSVPASFAYQNDTQWQKVTFDLYVSLSDFATGNIWKLCLHQLATNASTKDIKVAAIYIDDFTIEYTGLHSSDDVQRFIPQRAETWVAEEIILVSDTNAETFTEKEIDLILTHSDGTTLTIPGFWDGENIFRIRYALTKTGSWNYQIICSDPSDDQLQASGVILCSAYSGDLDIYEHGFIKTVNGTRHFMYNDGTPFFYLGDTHWALGQEAKDVEANFTGYTIDTSGTFASGIKYTGNASDSVTINFAQKLAQTRAQQGFTVIQSEPLGAAFNLENGVTGADIKGLRQFDDTFKAIADAGLVHANAEFFYPSQMVALIQFAGGMDTNKILCYSDDTGKVISQGEYNQNPEQEEHVDGTNHIIYDYTDSVYTYLDKLTRYWVARYSAYPVMWTLGQEVDNDFYFNRTQNGGHVMWNSINNPYLLVAAYIEKYDAYRHPLSAHQESIGSSGTECLGNGIGYYLAGSNFDQNGNIVKLSDKVLTAIDTTGYTLYYGDSQTRPSAFRNVSNHTWYAAQLSPTLNASGAEQMNNIAKDYWYNGQGKVIVNYEPRYCYLWTKNYGMRARGWTAYLSGMFGFAYGAQDTWDYLATYNEDADFNDSTEYITAEEKQAATYIDGLNYKSADQLGYARNFFENIVGDWQNLIPRFNDTSYFTKTNSGVLYHMASNSDNSKAVIYFYTVSVTEGGFNNDSQLAADILQMHNGGYDMPASSNGSSLASTVTGTVKQLTAGATYQCTWFNPRTGQTGTSFTKQAGLLGNLVLNSKPDGCDWVLYIQKI